MRNTFKFITTALAATTLLATSVFAQQSTRFPNAQIDPLAGIGIARDAQGRKIIFDLESERIISIDGSRPVANTAPLGSVVRGPLQTATNQPLPAPQNVDPNMSDAQLGPIPQTNQVGTTVTASIPKLENPIPAKGMDIAILQVLLDRKGISPGVIDGQSGSNVRKALSAYSQKFGRDISSLTALELRGEMDATGGPAFINYTIQPDDVNGPFVAAIPVDYAQKAQLPAMSYTSPVEKFAEKFHMDENYLRKLNPGVDFNRAGSVIKVANIGQKVTQKIVRIEADKGAEQVRAFDANGNLVVAYPATIGSAQTPSPSGVVTIERIAVNPNYTYNPKINFTQGENREILTIPPGPNGPVGTVWLALSKPTYGIHGTPDPSRIGKTNSHGCIRLTNWDAEELAKMVSKGVTVTFLE